MNTTNVKLAKKERAKTEASLRKIRNSNDLRRITVSFHARLDELFWLIARQEVRRDGRSVVCKANCAKCCYLKIDADAHEVFRLTRYIREHLSEEQISVIVKAAEGNRKRILSMTLTQQRGENIRCPLLENERCLCYEARPSACRRFHATDRTTCDYTYFNPRDLRSEDSQIADVGELLLLVHAGVREAFNTAGYDARSYDLGSALAEALSSPDSEQRWVDRKKAFSEESVAKDWSEEDTKLDSL